MTTKRLTRKQRRQQTSEVENVFNKKFSMKKISPMTENQSKMMSLYLEGKNIANIGSAGTGKTYLALYMGLKSVLEEEEYEKVIVIRSAVQSREQGFMPGSVTEKMSYYEGPYIDITSDLFGRGDAYQILKQKGMISFMSTSFVRGLTFDNAIIIVDEAQNMNYEEVRTIMTRVGEGSKIIFCGDTKQDDLKNSKNRSDMSGLVNLLKVIKKMPEDFGLINFTTDDIVRSGIVKKFIIREEEVLAY